MKKNQGFSLIEVLVTILLTTIGILGMVALQGKSIQYTQDTVHREAAISAADELIEIMRVYRDELFVNIPPKQLSSSAVRGSYGEFYSQLESSTDLYDGEANIFTASNCPSDGEPSEAIEVAGCWLKNQQEILPDFQVERLCPSANANSCTSDFKGSSMLLSLSWQSRDSSCGEDGSAAVCEYSVRVEL